MMKMTVKKTDDDREKMMSLISAMKADGQITSEQFMEVRAAFGFLLVAVIPCLLIEFNFYKKMSVLANWNFSMHQKSNFLTSYLY